MLNAESDDIDLAIDHSMSASAYAHALKDVLEQHPFSCPDEIAARVAADAASQEEGEPSTVSRYNVSKISVMSARPEQGKNVETATFKLCSYSLDVSGLRGEVRCGMMHIIEKAYVTSLY